MAELNLGRTMRQLYQLAGWKGRSNTQMTGFQAEVSEFYDSMRPQTYLPVTCFMKKPSYEVNARKGHQVNVVHRWRFHVLIVRENDTQ